MNSSTKKLYQRVQSSTDDSEDSTPPHEPKTRDGATADQPKPTTSPRNASKSSQDEEARPPSQVTRSAKKTVMIEIKGKSPPGQDGVFALNRDLKCTQFPSDPHAAHAESNPNHGFPGRKFEYKPSLVDFGSTLLKDRSIDTRKNTLDRVKRLQERAGIMMDVKDRIQGRVQDRMQDRRDRSCGVALNRYNSSVQRFQGAGFESTLAEKPALVDVDSKHEGVLKISDRSFCENGCEALLRVIKNNEKLVELDLSGCNIHRGDDLAQIVRSATSLKRLSLEWNCLGLARTGVAALSSAIASNHSLKEVDLRSNRIGPSTAAALAHALQSNYSLTCLDLRWNEIGPGGAAAIVAMLQRNHCLTDVRLVGNGIPPSTQAQIDELLEKNRTCKLLEPAGPLLDVPHSFIESDIGLNSKVRSKDMRDINLERIASLQTEIDSLRQSLEACKTELYEVQLQKVASDTQLETIQVELKEEKLLRKFIEKETGDFKSHMNFSKQQIHDMEDKLMRNEQMAVMKLTTLNSEVMEAREKAHQAQVAEAEAKRENKHLKDQMARIQTESKARVDATQERTKNDIDYKSSIINRLEGELAQLNSKQKEEVDSIRAKFNTHIKNLEIARDNAIQEINKQKSIAMQYETQLATNEQSFKNEKEATQKIFDGKINSMKIELATLKNHLENNNLEQQKLKKKHASIIEDYENQITHLTTSMTKLEVIKSGLEEKMMVMSIEQDKLHEKLKNGDTKHREMELKMEAEHVKHAQTLAHEVAKHLEDRKSLENEILATRRQIEVVHLHVKEIQSEQERRKFDTERRVTGAETAVLEWVHQQFASLKSALIVQHSVASVG